MKNLNLISALLLAGTSTVAAAQNTYSLVASDFQFNPLELNINVGDTVRISLNPGHSFREVSQETWDLNVGAPGIGWEFEAPTVLTVHDLVTTTPGTIYYVCVQHVSDGMKGIINVAEGPIGIGERKGSSYRLHPNPTTGWVSLKEAPEAAVRARVLDATGRPCLEHTLAGNNLLDLRSLVPGGYTVQLVDRDGMILVNEMVILEGR